MNLRRALIFVSFTLLSTLLHAETYIVGAQNIRYYPHYDFDSTVDKGIGWAILEAFSVETGHEFIYHAMPIERLQRELSKGNVDFVYPDNPKWFNPTASAENKYFSTPLVHALGGNPEFR